MSTAHPSPHSMPGAGSSAPLSLRERLRRGTLFNLLSSGFGQGSTVAINIVVARMLGREVFGKYALVQSTLLTVAALAQIATGSTATKYIAEFRSTDRSRTGRIVGLCELTTLATSATAFAVLLVCADWLARFAIKEPSLALALRLGAAFVVFNCLNFYQVGALAGLESYPSLARTSLFGGVVAGCVSIPLTWVFGLNGATVALVLASMARWGFCQQALRRELHRHDIIITYRNVWRERVILRRFAVPAALSGFLTMPATWFANLFLIQQANGFAQNALYNAAMTLKAGVMFLSNNANSVGTSMLNNQKAQNDRRRYRRLYLANLGICCCFTLLGGGAILLVGPYVLRLYGKSFADARPVLGVLLLAAVLETMSLGIYQIIQNHERMWTSLLLIALPVSIVLPLLSYRWSPRYGAIGLAFAVVVTTSVHLVITCLVAWPIAKTEL